MDIAEGKLEEDGIPKGILNSPHHFDILKRMIHEKYLPPLKLHEFFTIDEELEFHNLSNKPINDDQGNLINYLDDDIGELRIVLDPERKRLGSSVKGCVKNGQDLKAALEKLNKRACEECKNNVDNAIENVLSGAKYERLDEKGIKTVEDFSLNPFL